MTDKIAGECDICGTVVDLDVHGVESFEVADDEAFPVSPEEAIDALTSALESVGTDEDLVLAETLREKQRCFTHEQCFAETALDDEGLWAE